VNARIVAVIVVTCLLAGCGSQYAGSTVGQQVESWATSSPDPKFSSALSTLRADIARTDGAEASNDEAALRTDCDVLVTDALSANQNLPTPDSDLSNILSRAYTAAADAGKDCLCAAGGGGCSTAAQGQSSLYSLSVREGMTADRGFIAAEARVDFLTSLSGGGG